jgi:hypothetical protein
VSLDATEVRLTKRGKVTIFANGDIEIEGFHGKNCSCRDVAVLAMLWAIGVLQKDVTADIQKPGGGRCAIAD